MLMYLPHSVLGVGCIESSIFDTGKIQHDSLNELYHNKERLCKKAQTKASINSR